MIILFLCSLMKILDPEECLENEYNEKVNYNFWISTLLSQPQYNVVSEFLEVPNFDKKGK